MMRKRERQPPLRRHFKSRSGLNDGLGSHVYLELRRRRKGNFIRHDRGLWQALAIAWSRSCLGAHFTALAIPAQIWNQHTLVARDSIVVRDQIMKHGFNLSLDIVR